MELNDVSGEVVRAAIRVHSALGPGLPESAYRACLRHDLFKRGLRADVEVVLPVKYDGITLDLGYRLDLLVEDAVIVELKTVKAGTGSSGATASQPEASAFLIPYEDSGSTNDAASPTSIAP